MSDKLDQITEKMNNIASAVREVQQLLKGLPKQKRNKKDANTTTSSLSKPVTLSSEMRAFLDLDADTQISRVDVLRSVNKYIKDNNLQIPDNKRNFVLDEKLKTIIPQSDDPELQYQVFKIQSYIKSHFT